VNFLDCKIDQLCFIVNVDTNWTRIDNEDKLREKVNEALAVYDDYLKNSENAGAVESNAEANGTSEETSAAPTESEAPTATA